MGWGGVEEVVVVLHACLHRVALCCSVSSLFSCAGRGRGGGTGGAGMIQRSGCVCVCVCRVSLHHRSPADGEPSITLTPKGLQVVDGFVP